MSWLNEVVKQHEEFEAPLSFVWWSALCAMSAIVKDNIWIDRHLFRQYPNIYVLLYADSGLKKGPSIAMAKKYVRAVNNTNIISGRSSIQGILSFLHENSKLQTKPGGEIVGGGCSAFICSSEMSSSLVEDKAALDILTDLFDRYWNDGDWNHILKSERFNIKDPTVSLLGGINQAHAEAFFTKKDVQGGYIGRSFIIHETMRNRRNSLVYRPKYPPDDKKNIEWLKKLSSIKGPFKPLEETEVGEMYDEWYNAFWDRIERHDIKDITGTLNRFSESVIKVAMLISLSNDLKLEISKEAMKEAIEKCERFIGAVRETTMAAESEHQWALEKTIAIKELVNRDNHMISREQLNKKYYLRANADEWDKIMESLATAGMITMEQHGNQIVYVMSDDKAKWWINHFKGK